MNALKSLQDHGQAVWLDFLSRGFVAKGGLKKLRDEDGLRGVTSNPSIFGAPSAIPMNMTTRWRKSLKHQDRPAGDEELAVEDIQRADRCAPPSIRYNARRRRLCQHRSLALSRQRRQGHHRRSQAPVGPIDRKNLMIKVPGTPEGMPAIHDLIADGINVNITLLFAQRPMSRLSRPICPASKCSPRKAATRRASRAWRLLVSRIDTAVDKLLDEQDPRAPSRASRRKETARSARRQDRHRQCQARRWRLSAPVCRRALGRAQNPQRQATAACGLDRHQEQGL